MYVFLSDFVRCTGLLIFFNEKNLNSKGLLLITKHEK